MSTRPQTYETIPAITGLPMADDDDPLDAPEATRDVMEPNPRRDAVMVGVCMTAYVACLGFALNIIFGTLT